MRNICLPAPFSKRNAHIDQFVFYDFFPLLDVHIDKHGMQLDCCQVSRNYKAPPVYAAPITVSAVQWGRSLCSHGELDYKSQTTSRPSSTTVGSLLLPNGFIPVPPVLRLPLSPATGVGCPRLLAGGLDADVAPCRGITTRPPSPKIPAKEPQVTSPIQDNGS